MATDIEVKGVVKDKSGNLLAGANVTIKGTTISTITDVDGNYKIKCPIGEELVYSYAGLKPKIVKVDSNPVINVTWQIFDIKTIGAIVGVTLIAAAWYAIYIVFL